MRQKLAQPWKLQLRQLVEKKPLFIKKKINIV